MVAGAVRGVSVADVVHDAIEAVWSGRRSWDSATVPLATFLKNSVRSEISNLFDLADVKWVDGWPEGGDGGDDDPMEDAMQTRHADVSHDHARHLPRPPRTPEEIVAEQQQVDIYHDLLLEAAGDDDELVRYLDALDKGLQPAEIAREWRTDAKAIYVVENRLRKRVRKLVASRHVNA